MRNRPFHVAFLDSTQLNELAALVDAYPFTRHRGYRHFGRDLEPTERSHIKMAFDPALEAPGTRLALAAVRDSRLVGAALLNRSDFDTEHFDVEVCRLLHLTSADEPALRRAVASELCAAALQTVDGLVLLDIDSEDVHALAGAQEAGFRVYDAKLTYVTERPTEIRAPVDPRITVRCFDRENPPDLTSQQVDRMARESAAAFRQSHFHADPLLPDDRCDALYDTWARNILTGRWADWWVVAFDDQGPQGCVGLRYSPLFGADHEPSIIGDPFGFTTHPRGAGVGTAMLHVFTRDAPGDFVEDQTQVRTTPLLVAIPRVARFLRSHYTLHGWSRETATRQRIRVE